MKASDSRAMAVCALFVFLGCSGDSGPNQAALRNALASALPGHITVEKFSVEVAENMGTKVEPVYATRFRAVLRFSADTFSLDKRERDVLFLSPIKKQGDTMEVFGKSASQLYGGSWRTEVSIDGSSVAKSGKPLAEFTGRTVLVRDSAEEKAYFQAKEAEAQRLALESDIRKAEAEERRQTALREIEERRQTAAHEAQQRRLDQAREAEELRQALGHADELILGKWRWLKETTEFRSDGNWIAQPDGGAEQLGRWRIDGQTLSIAKEQADGRMDTQRYTIVYISSGELRLGSSPGSIATGRRVQ